MWRGHGINLGLSTASSRGAEAPPIAGRMVDVRVSSVDERSAELAMASEIGSDVTDLDCKIDDPPLLKKEGHIHA